MNKQKSIVIIAALIVVLFVMMGGLLTRDTDDDSQAEVDYQALISVTDAISDSIDLRDTILATKLSYKAMEEEGTISQSTTTTTTVSYRALDPSTFVTTESGSILAASTNGYHGTISIPDASVYYAPLYRSSDSTLIDVNIYATELLSWTGYLGIAGSTPVICGHNNIGVFGRLGRLSVGSYIYFDTSYGQFIYRVTGFAVGDLGDDGNIYFDGTDLISYARGGGSSLILYTCYPFTAHPATQRYIVYATLVDGTTLS